MASSLKYEVGTLRGGLWKQWANYIGEDVYQNLTTGATQLKIPAGYEDRPSVSIFTSLSMNRADLYRTNGWLTTLEPGLNGERSLMSGFCLVIRATN